MRANLLKYNGYGMKNFSYSRRWCNLCDNFATEDISHLQMQCLHFEEDRSHIYGQFFVLELNVVENFSEDKALKSFICHQLLGLMNEKCLCDLWILSGKIINLDLQPEVAGRNGER